MSAKTISLTNQKGSIWSSLACKVAKLPLDEGSLQMKNGYVTVFDKTLLNMDLRGAAKCESTVVSSSRQGNNETLVL